MAIEGDVKLNGGFTTYGSYEKLSGKPEKRQSQLVWVSLLLGIATGLGIGWMFGSPISWAESSPSNVRADNAFFDYFLGLDTSVWKSPRIFQKTCIPKYAPGASDGEKCAAYCLNPEGDHVTFNSLGLVLRMDDTGNQCSESYNTAYGTAEVQSYGRYLYGDFSVYMKAGHGTGGTNEPGSKNAETCFALFGSDRQAAIKQEINFCILSRWTYQNFTTTYYAQKGGGGMYHFPTKDFSKEYHLFQFKWRPNSIHWLVDNESVFYQSGTPGVNIPDMPLRISLILRPDSYSDFTQYQGPAETTIRFAQYNGAMIS
mmetsp:Transcript_19677/g.27466  ORF Transcript_19677/g.27466 Transcript_19677/m.27466 type:complete len:314 (-) Transcript_19677:47-988(-)|eukprot:CAMPEP_0184504608 /NCGR_PEP_ID=MMETSP0113_2-20130426/52552_1 /TAXON_ID=91329 /ORGANISM="Norrisiella sphaerica, Strain BC52" /LENGTH=313 /DNA_ID=CAMNT_0026894261 /DNA_START=1501 /DNA_END=2442 /DNA_ORIENTATION=-